MAPTRCIITLVNIATLCLAVPWSGPRQTDPVREALINENGWTPIPTMAPMPKNPMVPVAAGRLDRMWLLAKRQDPQDFCGIYNSDGFDTTLSCGASDPSCIVSNTFMDCCNGDANCAIYTTCYDASNIAEGSTSVSVSGSSSVSTDAFAYTCQSDSPDASFCLTFYRTDGSTLLTGYTCGPSATSITVSLSQPPTTSRDFAYTPPPMVSSSSNSSSGTNVGAIAGGVVGGIVAIALICGLLYYFCVMRKRQTGEGEKQPMQPNNYAYGPPELQGRQIHEAEGTEIAADPSFGGYYKSDVSPNLTTASHLAPQAGAPPVFHEMPVNEQSPRTYRD